MADRFVIHLRGFLSVLSSVKCFGKSVNVSIHPKIEYHSTTSIDLEVRSTFKHSALLGVE